MRPHPHAVDTTRITTAHLYVVRSRATVRADHFAAESDDPFAVDEDTPARPEPWYADEVPTAV